MPESNGAQYRRDRYEDDFAPRAGADAAEFGDRLPDGARAGVRRVPEALSRAKTSVRRGLSGAQEYVRSHDMDDVLEDARNLARKNPRVAIVALVAAGFVLGRLMRRSR